MQITFIDVFFNVVFLYEPSLQATVKPPVATTSQ